MTARKALFSVFKIVFFLSLGFFFIWIFTRDLTAGQVDEIFRSFAQADYSWVGFSILIALGSHVLRTWRWQMLLKPLGYSTGFWNVFMSLMIGYFANLALPRLGEVTRCGFLARYENVPFQKSFGTVVAERAVDLLTFFLLFAVNLVLQYALLHQYVDEKVLTPLGELLSLTGKGPVLLMIIAAVCLILVALFVVFRRKWKSFRWFRFVTNIVRGFWEGLKSVFRLKHPFLFLIYSLAIWFSYFLMTWVCFFSMPEFSDMGMQAGFSVLVMGTIGIMVVQGGIGIYPVIVAETLVLYGAVATRAFALGWLLWTAQTLAIIIAGLVSIVVLPLYNKKKHGNT